MNFISKNLNKAQSLVTKLEFVTKDFKAQFQYPAHAPKVFRVFFFFQQSTCWNSLQSTCAIFRSKKKKNNLTVTVELPSSRLSSHRRQWAPTVADEAPLRANRRRLSSTVTLRIPSNRRPFDFPTTLRIPLNRRPFAFLQIGDHSTSRRPFAFLWIGDHSTSRRPFTFLWTGNPSPSRWPFAFLRIGHRSLPKAQFPPGDRSPSFPQVLSLSLSL